MAPVDGAHVLKNAIVKINTVEYTNQVDTALLTPDTPIQQRRTLVPDGVVTDVDSPMWVCQFAGLQVNKTGGLARALRAFAVGEIVSVELTPVDEVGEQVATFDMRIIPPPFGGKQGSWAEIDLTFPVIGQPVFDDVAA